MKIGSYSIISQVWDVATRPKFYCAVLVIIFIQYRSTIINFIGKVINDGIIETIFDLILKFADLIREYYHLCHEIIRSNYVFSYVDECDGGKNEKFSMLRRETRRLYNDDNPDARGCNNDNKRFSYNCGPPPPLVMMNNSNRSTQDETSAAKSIDLSNDVNSELKNEIEEKALAPLEPAFLNKKDYPPGWLVYHPVLGVSSLEEADQYDKKLTRAKTNC